MIDTIYSDPNFLQHYGVKGMKWGVRKDEYKTAKRNKRTAKSIQAKKDFHKVKSTYKRDKKIARTSYNIAYKTAYDFSTRHPISQFIKNSENYEISNALWSDASRLGEEYVKNYGLLEIGSWKAPV